MRSGCQACFVTFHPKQRVLVEHLSKIVLVSEHCSDTAATAGAEIPETPKPCLSSVPPRACTTRRCRTAVTSGDPRGRAGTDQQDRGKETRTKTQNSSRVCGSNAPDTQLTEELSSGTLIVCQVSLHFVVCRWPSADNGEY